MEFVGNDGNNKMKKKGNKSKYHKKLLKIKKNIKNA